MNTIIFAVLVLGVMGLLFGLILAFASKIFAVSQSPEQWTWATIFSLSVTSTPRTFAIFSAEAAPPTGQPFTGALPSTIAVARPLQHG